MSTKDDSRAGLPPVRLGGKECLALMVPEPERFGTVSHTEGTWTIVVPFNDDMRKRALFFGPDKAMVVYR